ncbi:MAG: type I DNA topoisomerase [Acetivibrionales bacterium]|jgi:DNA topoisomerase-1
MANNLVIVESPAKANTIGKFLGKDYKIIASVGHVRDLPKSQLGVDVDNDFKPKYITIRGKGDIIAKLKKEAKNAKKVYLATDPDREGEAISWHLAYLLNIDEEERCRITFNEITKSAVKNSLKASRAIDMNLVDAQQARRILDRIVGYKISPLLWKNVKKGLSAGRVQSVATRLICDREEEIEKFIPKEYWSITAMLAKIDTKESFEAKFYGRNNEKIELGSEEQVNKVLDGIMGQEFVVNKVKKGEKRKSPAPPFITSTMQQEASRKLGFSTKKTMIVAQQLYEGINIKGVGAVGLVTYIRSDSTRISPEAQKAALELIKGKYGNEYVPVKQRIFKNRNASQDAHEAIRPTYVDMEPGSIKDSLSRDQYKLYKLVWERFIASQMSSAVYDTINADIEANGYIFKASGSKIKFPGFVAVYMESRDEETEEDTSNIPDLEDNEILRVLKTEPKQHFTQPPQRYTEASLVRELEEKGIGRPSTYAPTITTILARGYIQKEKKTLFPTELGRIVNDIMKNNFPEIVDIKFTAEMEKKLDDVEEGEKKWIEIIREFYRQFESVFKEAESKIGRVEIKDEETDIVCEKCGRNMVIKIGRYGKFLACPGFPECRNTKPIFEETGVNCPACGGKVLIKKTRKGKKYYGCENYPECGFMTWDKPVKEKCPKCGNFLLSKGFTNKGKLKCSNEECDYESNDKKGAKQVE